MQVRIKKNVGALINSEGLLRIPTKDQEISVDDAVGQALVEAGSAEKLEGGSEQTAQPVKQD